MRSDHVPSPAFSYAAFGSIPER